MVAVEPRMSIAAAKAEEWIPIRPATDRHFAMSMSSVLVEEGLCDYEFLKKDTNAVYLVGDDQLFIRDEDGDMYVWDTSTNSARKWNDDFESTNLALEGEYEVNGKKCRPAFQIYKNTLVDSSPEKMEELTTIPAATVRRIAREFAKEARIVKPLRLQTDVLFLIVHPPTTTTVVLKVTSPAWRLTKPSR